MKVLHKSFPQKHLQQHGQKLMVLPDTAKNRKISGKQTDFLDHRQQESLAIHPGDLKIEK